MSRSRKMLNMLEKRAEDPVFSTSFSIVPAANITNNGNTVLNIGDNDMIPQSSPLPPGAETISRELADIWEEAMDEDDRTHNITSSVQSSNSQMLHPSVEDVYPNQPSTFSLENIPSSYENSPLIHLEDLISDDYRSTPNHLEPAVPTPMPSPSNIHTNCSNAFCPSHDINTNATPKPKTTKRRKRCPKEWKDNKRKCLKNSGKTYTTKKGKTIEELSIRPPCTCRNKCTDKITNQQRVACFEKFWQLGDRAKQWNFIIKYSDKIKKKRCLNQDTPNNRKFTYKYYLPLITGSNEIQCEKTEVCQIMFINTLAVSTRIIKTAWKKYDGSTIIEEDRRGRHDNHRIIINDAMKQSVCDHVRAFVPIESHYIRKNSQKLYLQGDLSIAKMFKLYLEWFDPDKYISKVTTERQYRDIVNSNFNLAFHIPKKDQCDECHVFRSKANPTNQEKEEFQQHQTNKKVARDLKSQDKKDAEESNRTLVTAVFDFEKVLPCPHGNVNLFYYKRKLSSYNFTVYDMGKRKAVCFMWDESVAKRGANEVSSCLLDFIQTNVEQGVKEFRLWSDNCAGQNRNRFVFSMYVYAAKKFNIRITHRFLQKGHTQNEGDSVHSVIERVSQTKTIFTPHEWRLLVRWAKNEGEPYVVRNVTQNDVFDFKCLVNNKVWMKDIKGAKINWSNIREVNADGSDPNKLFFKYDLSQPYYNILVIRGNTRNSAQTQLKPAYSELIKLPAAKYKDLMDMCRSQVIPLEYHTYFNCLSHHIQITEESDDDLSE